MIGQVDREISPKERVLSLAVFTEFAGTAAKTQPTEKYPPQNCLKKEEEDFCEVFWRKAYLIAANLSFSNPAECQRLTLKNLSMKLFNYNLNFCVLKAGFLVNFVLTLLLFAIFFYPLVQ